MSETIVMIHGMFGGAWYWENFRNYFEQYGFRCAVPTLRFHDIHPPEPAPPQLGTTSILDYASDLEQQVRQLPAPPILMGHSMGGLLAQILGARNLARALILLTPASPAGILALRFSVIKSFRGALTTWQFWEKPIRPTFEEAVFSMLHLLPPAQQHEAYERFGYESGRAAFEIGFWLLDARKATRVDESRITVPMLIIGAAEDRITPVSVVRKVATKYRHIATYCELPRHAHWLMNEPGWEKVAALIKGWLESIALPNMQER